MLVLKNEADRIDAIQIILSNMWNLMAKKNEAKLQTLSAEKYGALIERIKARIVEGQIAAISAVNKELMHAYWEIGKYINEEQKNESKGKKTVEKIAHDLQSAMPTIKGFSSRNLWYMRDLYFNYHKNSKLQTLSAQISWSHNIAILEKCEDNLEREFYLKMTRKLSWSYRTLLNNIEQQLYERTLLGQTNFDKTLPADIKSKARLLVKDEYMFDFLDLGDEYLERTLEAGLVAKVEPFLKEMGGIFAFIGSQYRLEISGKEYFIDLLLYHRNLKCLVAVELKIGEFIPEYVGKMQFYLSALDSLERVAGENPSIGIILCKSKDRTIVEFTLKDASKPIGVATYKVTKDLPKELKKQLPTPEQIELLLEALDIN